MAQLMVAYNKPSTSTNHCLTQDMSLVLASTSMKYLQAKSNQTKLDNGQQMWPVTSQMKFLLHYNAFKCQQKLLQHSIICVFVFAVPCPHLSQITISFGSSEVSSWHMEHTRSSSSSSSSSSSPKVDPKKCFHSCFEWLETASSSLRLSTFISLCFWTSHIQVYFWNRSNTLYVEMSKKCKF